MVHRVPYISCLDEARIKTIPWAGALPENLRAWGVRLDVWATEPHGKFDGFSKGSGDLAWQCLAFLGHFDFSLFFSLCESVGCLGLGWSSLWFLSCRCLFCFFWICVFLFSFWGTAVGNEFHWNLLASRCNFL